MLVFRSDSRFLLHLIDLQMASPLRTTTGAMDGKLKEKETDVKRKETDAKSDVKQNVKADQQTKEDKGAIGASASKRSADVQKAKARTEDEDQDNDEEDDGEGEEEEPTKPLTKTERSKREKVFLISIAFYASRLGRFFAAASTGRLAAMESFKKNLLTRLEALYKEEPPKWDDLQEYELEEIHIPDIDEERKITGVLSKREMALRPLYCEGCEEYKAVSKELHGILQNREAVDSFFIRCGLITEFEDRYSTLNDKYWALVDQHYKQQYAKLKGQRWLLVKCPKLTKGEQDDICSRYASRLKNVNMIRSTMVRGFSDSDASHCTCSSGNCNCLSQSTHARFETEDYQEKVKRCAFVVAVPK